MSAITALVPAFTLIVILTLLSQSANAIERPEYELVDTIGDVEIRRYEAHTVARTLVTGTFTEAGNLGFRRLAGYIFGGNQGEKKIKMTAPVLLAPHYGVPETSVSESSMTETKAPGAVPGDQYWVTFNMPREHKLAELPAPEDTRVELVTLPGKYMAVLRYRGNWSEARYLTHQAALMEALTRTNNWVKQGSPSWARFNPPFTPSFLRTNEVSVEVRPSQAKAI